MQVTIDLPQGPVEELGLSFGPMVELTQVGRFLPKGLEHFLERKGMENKTNIGKEDSTDGMNVMETAGRICYMSFSSPRPGGSVAYLNNILESGHGSVTEHVSYSFIIHGTSRSLTHEHVRHRAGWAYSQLSQRFVGERHVRFVVPPRYRLAVLTAIMSCQDQFPVRSLASLNVIKLYAATGQLEELEKKGASKDELILAGTKWLNRRAENLAEYAEACEQLKAMYSAESKSMETTEFRKLLRQTARNCLPNSTETYYFATANVRALRHFFEKRGNIHADEEIRDLAVALAETVRDWDSSIFPDMKVEPSSTFKIGSVALNYPKV